jgi:hypothetical protein
MVVRLRIDPGPAGMRIVLLVGMEPHQPQVETDIENGGDEAHRLEEGSGLPSSVFSAAARRWTSSITEHGPGPLPEG